MVWHRAEINGNVFIWLFKTTVNINYVSCCCFLSFFFSDNNGDSNDDDQKECSTPKYLCIYRKQQRLLLLAMCDCSEANKNENNVSPLKMECRHSIAYTHRKHTHMASAHRCLMALQTIPIVFFKATTNIFTFSIVHFGYCHRYTFCLHKFHGAYRWMTRIAVWRQVKIAVLTIFMMFNGRWEGERERKNFELETTKCNCRIWYLVFVGPIEH